jgi:hypothetical protein
MIIGNSKPRKKMGDKMTKLYIMLLILMATFCITGGLCNDFCLGPYAITFNDTQKPVLMASFGPFYSIYNDKLVSNYTSLSISNNSSFEISITESAFTFDEAYNLTKEMLNPAIGTTGSLP